MDQDTGQALYAERITRSPEALAVEVVTLRAWFGALDVVMDRLKGHIAAQALDNRSNVIDELCLKARVAGGLAAIDLLAEWVHDSMGDINDFTTKVGIEDHQP